MDILLPIFNQVGFFQNDLGQIWNIKFIISKNLFSLKGTCFFEKNDLPKSIILKKILTKNWYKILINVIILLFPITCK